VQAGLELGLAAAVGEKGVELREAHG
jgi:hypothetical protein